MVPALPLQTEELQQQSHRLFGLGVKTALCFPQQPGQAGFFREHPGRKPGQVTHVALPLETRVEALAQSLQQWVGQPAWSAGRIDRATARPVRRAGPTRRQDRARGNAPPPSRPAVPEFGATTRCAPRRRSPPTSHRRAATARRMVLAVLGAQRKVRGPLRHLAPQRGGPPGASARPEDALGGRFDHFAQCATRMVHGFVIEQRGSRALLERIDEHGKRRQGFVVWEFFGECAPCRSGADRVAPLQGGSNVVAQHGVATVSEDVELLQLHGPDPNRLFPACDFKSAAGRNDAKERRRTAIRGALRRQGRRVPDRCRSTSKCAPERRRVEIARCDPAGFDPPSSPARAVGRTRPTTQ